MGTCPPSEDVWLRDGITVSREELGTDEGHELWHMIGRQSYHLYHEYASRSFAFILKV